MDRFYYQNIITGFLADFEDAILGALGGFFCSKFKNFRETALTF